MLLALVVNLVWFLPKFYPEGLAAVPAAPAVLIAVGLMVFIAALLPLASSEVRHLKAVTHEDHA